MNTEYALLKILLQNPDQLTTLTKNGFKSVWLSNKEYAKAYDVILDRYIRFQSTPTSEELAPFNVSSEKEDVPHTLDHCVSAILEKRNKELFGLIARKAVDTLSNQGVEKAKELVLQSVSLLPKLETQERSREVSTTAESLVQDYYGRVLNRGKIIGLSTGFDDFDAHFMGFMPQWLVVIGARNGVGKTTLISEWAKHNYLAGKNIVIFSCEMSRREVEIRIHSLASRVPPRKIDLGTLDMDEQDRYIKYLQETVEVQGNGVGKLVVNDNPISLDNIALELNHLSKEMKIDGAFIDAAYRMQGEGKTDTERYGSIARGCKDLAKKYEIPFVCTVQLNRDFAKANEGKNAKSKTQGGSHYVYGSDAWNQDADVVLSMNQPEDYAPYNYIDLLTDKFRHGDGSKDFMIHMNLQLPIVRGINREIALMQIEGENAQAQAKTDNIMAEADEEYAAVAATPAPIYATMGEAS